MLKSSKAARSHVQWNTKLPGVNTAILPPQTTRPNPLAMGDSVFASLLAPGAVCAVSRESGEILWMRNLNSFASSSVFVHGRILYATSVQTLYALDPKSGRTRWEFSPKQRPGEWIYSQPAVKAGRVFIGDRCGYLHCLEAAGNLFGVVNRREVVTTK
jgi:outer membrane protein assembly factor BamB